MSEAYLQAEAFSTAVDRGPFLQTPSSRHPLLTSSKPSLSGRFLGMSMYLEGITGGFRTTQWEGRWMQKWYEWDIWETHAGSKVRNKDSEPGGGKEKWMQSEALSSVWTPAAHRWPPAACAWNCRSRPPACCGIAAAQAGSRTSPCYTQTSGHLWRVETLNTARDGSLDISDGLWRTRHPSGEGEHDDVVERPAVLWVWRVEGQLPGRLLPQVYQEGGVDHGDCEAAPPHLLPNGYVGRGALIVTLRRQSWLLAESSERTPEHSLSWTLKGTSPLMFCFSTRDITDILL